MSIIEYSLIPNIYNIDIAKILSDLAKQFNKQVTIYINIELKLEDINTIRRNISQYFNNCVELSNIIIEVLIIVHHPLSAVQNKITVI